MNKTGTAAVAHPSPPTNPFSSVVVTPGAIPFICAPGQDLDQLLTTFQAADLWGQIVGPHGSGKSTLLTALLPKLTDLGYHIESIALHDGQRRLPTGFPEIATGFPDVPPGETRAIVVVDGYEQLSWLARWRLRRLCRRRRWGLLVVAHASVGLPTLCQLQVSSQLATQIVNGLLRGRPFAIDEPEIAELLQLHRENLRDVLFDLYDRYEQVR